jgi:hypothetical protein
MGTGSVSRGWSGRRVALISHPICSRSGRSWPVLRRTSPLSLHAYLYINVYIYQSPINCCDIYCNCVKNAFKLIEVHWNVLGCNDMSVGEPLQTFRRIVVPSSPGSSSQRRGWRRNVAEVANVQNFTRFHGTLTAITKIRSSLGQFSGETQVLSNVVCWSIVPNLAQIGDLMWKVRIEIIETL